MGLPAVFLRGSRRCELLWSNATVGVKAWVVGVIESIPRSRCAKHTEARCLHTSRFESNPFAAKLRVRLSPRGSGVFLPRSCCSLLYMTCRNRLSVAYT